MWPPSYSRWATCIVRAAPKPNLREASCCIVVVRNGAYGLREAPFKVTSVEAKPYTRRPYAPFRTTTMQQEASRKFGFGAARTMQVAQ
ncbi:MAG: hypothetical protein EON52_28015, partial [Actinomycetales bacterium]